MPTIKQMMIASVAALVLGVDARGYKNGAFDGFMAADATVDITFSLECAQLESKPFERIHLTWSLDAFRVVEEMQSNAGALTETPAFEKRFGDWWKSTGVNHYDTGVRLAFNHGIPDGNSTSAVGNLRVVEATQERIDMRGKGDSSVVGAERGYIDRRTGYVEIWQFLSGSAFGLTHCDRSDDLNGRIERLEAMQRSLIQHHDILANEVDDIKSRLSSIDYKMDDIKGRLSGIEYKMRNEIDSRLSDVEYKLRRR